ncbi:MAG: N-acetylmuramoyl-L-alanine amidase [Chloroflexota bacterium]|nr:N-acetylmuramoyl-L-alanine amidase [Chloroflexota bacterium]
MTITYGKVPHPAFQNHLYVSEKKIQGMGWDNLGQRKPKFIALHRMYGTLAGTLSYFTPPTSPHLTDYAIGVEAIDGKNAGVIHKYNDPLGYRSGWASGRVSAPYGDGKALIDKYGINAVNRDGISIELSGFWVTPVDAFSWREYVKLIAYWVDYMRIPHASLPVNPHTGINAFIWHQEFTIGTGKVCPGVYLMDRTKQLYADVAAYLKPFQEGTVPAPTPTPTPVPEPAPAPLYKPAAPIAALIPFADDDVNAIPAAVKDANNEALEFEFVGDTVRLTKATPQFRYAGEKDVVGPDWPADTERYVPWMITLADKSVWYIDDQWRRIPRANTERIHDTKRAA